MTEQWRLVSPAVRQPLSPFLLEALPSWNRPGLWIKWEPIWAVDKVRTSLLHSPALDDQLEKKSQWNSYLHFCSWIFAFCDFSCLDINTGGQFLGKLIRQALQMLCAQSTVPVQKSSSSWSKKHLLLLHNKENILCVLLALFICSQQDCEVAALCKHKGWDRGHQ